MDLELRPSNFGALPGRRTSLFDLRGRVIVITGATDPLAISAAGYLARQGALLACLSRDAAALPLALDHVRALAPEALLLGLPTDLTDPSALVHARIAVLARWGRLDALIHTCPDHPVGPLRPASPAAAPPPSWPAPTVQEELDALVLAATHTTRAFAQPMLAARRGQIVHLCGLPPSSLTSRSAPDPAAAVAPVSRQLALELARRSHGHVRLNLLRGGAILHPETSPILLHRDGTLTPEGRDVIDRSPGGRFGDPHELHGALHYLLSDASSFVTGTTLVVDGGLSAAA